MKMSRKEVIEILEVQISSAEFVAMYTHNDRDAEKELKNAEAFRMAIEALKAYRPQGEWIRTSNDWIDGTCGARYYPIHCSICNYSTYDDSATNFCPKCGAQMKGADNE